ncbi:sulfatase-like hydrolase/transferase [Acinetobacter guillouiae]|uniref:sulfatase-like hydrolase/transferase n=1 Tax=Acinetobacter guillouiae TaxID=106649 RepID=UPI002E1D6E20|nr:sulfatase-like hydrolase/transferase [Acinetobacter guillouiae]
MKLLIFLVLTNILVYIVSKYLSLERIVINIDYLICLILLFFNLKKTSAIFFIFTFLADLLLLSRQIFPFFRIEDIFYIIQFIFISSLIYKFLLLSVFIYILIACLLIYKEKQKRTLDVYVAFLFSLLFFFQTIYNNIFDGHKNLFSSQMTTFIELQNEGFSQNLRMKQGLMQNLPYSTASKKLYTALSHDSYINHNVLFVVNESLGMPKDPAVLNQILLPIYNDKMVIHDLSINKTHYTGPTVYGELRELCHAQPNNFNLKSLQLGFETCLPQLFKKIGYETTAVHGALGMMYDRKYWYPRAGFQKMIFFESLQWKHRCYSFPGACDWEIGKLINDIFMKSEKPQFVYWLTLNSHSVYDERDIYFNVFDCKKFSIEENTESCRNLKLQAQFFYVLSKMIKSNGIKNTEVVVVGDHSPIIFNAAEKKKYFDEDNILILNFKVH